MTKDEILKLAQDNRLRPALIVTALASEMKAVRAHVTHIGSVPGRFGTVYECGRFSGRGNDWLIVVVECGAGTHAAQAAVTAAHMEFDNFEAVIVAGVAGSRKEDVPIGSVVASTYLYFPYSGKYDAGFKGRPHSIPCNQHLVGYAKKVARDEEWPTRICAPLKTKLPDQSAYPQPFPPAAFVAPIVSVEAVSADPESELEALIAEHCGDAHAVEMEGYGAAYAADREGAPMIAVRGISDMCGGKTSKNDAINQPVAAAHAAAFTFELIALWGEYKPVEAPTGREPAAASSPTSSGAALPPTTETASRQTLILNFAGTASDFPPEKVTQIIEALQAITNDPSLMLVGTEAGSFRMFIRAISSAIDKLRSQETFATLQREHSATLLGVVDPGEYQKALDVEEALTHASRELLNWPQQLPGGAHLRRPEFDQILSIFNETEHSTSVLLGEPGSGKSALLAAVGQELQKRRTPFLAIKADLLDPTIQTEQDLSNALSLPGSVGDLLLRISQLRPAVLLIDQLDALAGYVDLKTGRLSVLLNLVRKLGGRRNIHIFLSARTFEFSHDARLKTVRAESITLALPAWSDVLKVLEGVGVQAAGWPLDAQELIRVPQSLATFLKLKDRTSAPPFQKYQIMLDQLWKEKVINAPNGAQLATLASEVAETMAEVESLWLAGSRFEAQADNLNALIAAGILTDYDGSGGKIGFSHQTVFEHVLARAFARDRGRLSTYVLDRQASLFVRPKLWAALTYLREVEPPTYHAELEVMWKRQDLRPHLRHMLIEFMGQQASPTSIEESFFKQALESSDRQVALQSMIGSPGWFKGVIAAVSAVMESDSEIGVAAVMLDRAWSFASSSVKSLMKKHWLHNPSRDNYVWQVLQGNPNCDDESVEIGKTVLARTDIAPQFFDFLISTVGVDQPEVALKLSEVRLRRKLNESVKEANARAALTPPTDEQESLTWWMTNSPSKPITDVFEQQDGWEHLEAIAKDKGGLFLQYIWPVFLSGTRALRAVKKDDEPIVGFYLHHYLDFRFSGESPMSLPEPPLLGALTAAVESLASQDETSFLEWLGKNEHEDTAAVQRLCALGLASAPQRYAERAAQFFLDDKRRLYIGGHQDPQSTTKKLLSATSPFWSDDLLARFAADVVGFSPAIRDGVELKRRQSLSELVRVVRLNVLKMLPLDRLPRNVQRYIEEEQRRFPDRTLGVTFHGPSFIGSPMSRQSMEKAADDNILNAFQKLPDASDWDHPKRWMTGGNIQLSREFAEFAKENAERAMRIIRRFDPNIESRAAGYAIDSMSEKADPKAILELIVELNQKGFSSTEFRGGVARGIERLVRRHAQVGDDVLLILESWLSAPRKEEDEEESDPKNKEEEGADGSVLWGMGGLSVLPHGNYPILETITLILLWRDAYDRLVDFYVKHLETSENAKVWLALMRYFQYIRPSNLAPFGQFVAKLLARYPELSFKRETAVMLAQLNWRLPEIVHSSISEWKGASARMPQQAYGEIVGIMAINQPELKWPGVMLADLLKDPAMTHARVGATYAAVNHWEKPEFRKAASDILKAIIPQADKRGWSAIFNLFRVVDEITPEPEWISLLEVMTEHLPTMTRVDSSFVVDRLQTLLPHHATLVARLAKRLIANWKSELGDLRTGTALVARDLVDLAITLHRLGPETLEVGTEIFEDLLVVSAYTAQDTRNEIDNRFGATPLPARRRLPRRQQRQRRS